MPGIFVSGLHHSDAGEFRRLDQHLQHLGVDHGPRLQHEIALDALRSGMGFFSASKEGGSHLFFDGSVFRRKDYGDGPDWSAVYADDASMIDGLRRFYDWDARRDSYPHRKPDLEVWQYIHSQLRPR